MELRIDAGIFDKYPGLLAGIVICKGVMNDAGSPEIAGLLRDAEKSLRSRIADPEALKEHPVIAAWQEIHRAFGSNPNKFPSSIHALCKRVAKGGELPAINPLVDLYNVVSLTHMVPVGGEDLDQCKGDIVLTFAEGTESFTALGSDLNEPPEKGEVIYRDDDGVICRKFNWREAKRTCLTEKTMNAVLVIEAVPPTSRTELETALEQLQELVARFCGGTLKNAILDREHPSVSW